MIDRTAYVKALIKQRAGGTLSEEGRTELDRAKQRYSEEEWFRMEVEACCELEDGQPRKRPVDWRPVFDKALKNDRRSRRKVSVRRMTALLGGAAALLLVLWWGGRMFLHRPQPLDLGTNCPVWASDGEIPASEFACKVWWGDSTSITVDRTSRGRLGVIRNVEVWRYPDGVLALVPVEHPVAADTADIPAIRVVTQPYQQAVVRLPDGSEIRLNASSVLEYPLWNLDKDTTFLRAAGQALVTLAGTKKEDGAVKLIVETPNAQLQTSAGTYTVLAERGETRVALLEGKVSMFSRWGGERQDLLYAGEAVSMKKCCIGPDSAITTEISVSCMDEKDALGWTRMRRTYRNAPVREFVADMSRWYGFRVENMNCVPDGPRITATVCYRAPVGEVYAQIYAANVFMTERDGMVSFCGPLIDPEQPLMHIRRPEGMGLLAMADEGRHCCGNRQ